MGAMAAFLDRLGQADTRALYDGLDARWSARARLLNQRLTAAEVPVRVANLSSIWTVLYGQPGRYHWMLQYYLRLHGLALSWVGTGRLIFSLNYGDDDFAAVVERFVAACVEMKSDGWWWTDPALTPGAIRRGVLREMLAARWR
jgi:glutamate-1-semialdehyde 2,1-aminomutase